jgi:hypothetical protein
MGPGVRRDDKLTQNKRNSPGHSGNGGETSGDEQPASGGLSGGFVLDGDRTGGGASIADHSCRPFN